MISHGNSTSFKSVLSPRCASQDRSGAQPGYMVSSAWCPARMRGEGGGGLELRYHGTDSKERPYQGRLMPSPTISRKRDDSRHALEFSSQLLLELRHLLIAPDLERVPAAVNHVCFSRTAASCAPPLSHRNTRIRERVSASRIPRHAHAAQGTGHCAWMPMYGCTRAVGSPECDISRLL
jgi:hypothetical protein